MKKVTIIIGLLILAVAIVWFVWPNDSEVDNAMTGEQNSMNEENSEEMDTMESVQVMETGTYSADTSESVIRWRAGKPAISGYIHNGTFSLESGEVSLTDSELSGTFVVDMDSIALTSLGGGKAGQESTLEGHLKGERFFDTETYPTATFTITDVTPEVLPSPEQSEYTATGELTMKGQTNNVTFPIDVTVLSDSEVLMTASLPLDRTEWGIEFGSAKVVEVITDQVIGDTVTLEVELVLTK